MEQQLSRKGGIRRRALGTTPEEKAVNHRIGYMLLLILIMEVMPQCQDEFAWLTQKIG